MTSTFAPYSSLFENPQGPGDARPTALKVVEDEGRVNNMTDKVMLVTGCSSGIGIETARALHATGATLFMHVRDLKKGEAVVKDILATSPGKGKIELLRFDLDSLDSVRAGAAEFLKKSDKLNVLVNNAGVMATPEGKTIDGFETQWAVCHLSHFLLTNLLLPTLLASSTPSFASRVVNVSSTGHRFARPNLDDVNFATTPYEPWLAYSNAKSANIWTANALERRYGARGLHALSLHPGGISTGLQVHLDPALVASWSNPEILRTTLSPAQGAATQVWAAIGKAWEGRGGKYLEDVQLQEKQAAMSGNMAEKGYAPWAFDEESEEKCWKISKEMVGLKEDV
ncbi:Short-chain dehydrogenase [Lasiodiplodia theobromae]|uniref:Short-chain dehydrogenase n=1 Tax=Lasiodiplodia theobromae TaxID=45133 RepID=UPI0015C331DC|nr:Short-chain dehydrogenase [Lasiodiplodia theobromae]KAF4542454.1 Short-chain dehydrogenase [Lasiodiplodia theobromae]